MSKLQKWLGLFLIIVSLSGVLSLSGCATWPGTMASQSEQLTSDQPEQSSASVTMPNNSEQLTKDDYERMSTGF